MAYGDIVSSGTVSGSSGGTTVTGSSTAWASGPLPLRAGDQLYVGGYVYPITAVASDTSLTIGVPLQASVSGGTSYRAVLAAPTRQAVAEVADSIADLVKQAQFLTQSGNPILCVAVGTNTPPGSPATGDTYVIGTSPSGAWAGRAGQFARWTGTAWYFSAPAVGAMAIDTTALELYMRGSSAWNIRSLQVAGSTITDNLIVTGNLRVQGQPAVRAYRTGGATTLAAGEYGWAGTLGLNQGSWTTAAISGAISGAGLVVPKTGIYMLSMTVLINSGSGGRIYTTVNSSPLFSVVGPGGTTGLLVGASYLTGLTAGDKLGFKTEASISLYLADAHTYLSAAMVS
ncbi:DUF2793 domain-containing protein [Aquabacter sp. L1I39]|uniref:DUF2793 domain-containing protein n=1 Tax=Aquabacter sp. L1I39 TaxID=2820278 RepID=UPI001AD978B7|nr:DUF2793 domain-containing protein [Aquabacter sp. L1I39]QTL01903.1 DUF2793 domain-containing protein [Aquabacter sp. L1I39]